MVILPRNWRQISGVALANDVVSRVPVTMRADFQRLWVRTLLDIILENPLLKGQRSLVLKAVPGLGWRINSLLYAFFPVVDDNALEQCQEANTRWGVFAIVPEGYRELFTHGVEAACGRRPPSVMSLPDFTQWRLLWATLEYQRGQDELVADFARRFNRRLREPESSPLSQLELVFP